MTADAQLGDGGCSLVVRRMVRLPPEPGSARAARALVRQVLTEVGRLECVDAAELACTELVTNVVLHAHTDMEITVEVRDDVRVAVRDFNPTPPLQRHYDVQATTGRGMALVAALSDRHGIADAGPAGKTMWFSVGGPAPARSDEDVLAAWDSAVWDQDGWPEPMVEGPTRTVSLLRIPPTLWIAARQHHDAILRELAFYRTRYEVPVDLVAADRARSAISGAVMAVVERAQGEGTAQPVVPLGHPSPLPWVPEPFDLDLEVTPGTGTDAAALQDALDTAERLADEGKLLTRPGLPEIVAVRDWACEQIQAQLAGVPAAAWQGADHPGFAEEVDLRAARRLDAFTAAVRDSDRGVVAADDANRIVAISEPLAAALGWRPDELVGRRIVALIPPPLREAHVAGFTRHLTTGQSHVLGVPLVLPVLHRDGSEVTCRFVIEQQHPVAGHAMYVAWIEPVDAATGPADLAATGAGYPAATGPADSAATGPVERAAGADDPAAGRSAG